MHGYKGSILKICLTNKTFTIIKPDISIYNKYIGGKGLGGYFLKEHIQLDWQNPDMPLIFMTGPLVGTSSPTSGRMTIMSRSPLTGTIGDTSVGGNLGVFIKKAGFDGIIITGKSNELCGIEIDNGNIIFQNAEHLCNLKISEISNFLKDKGSIAVSGVASHKNVLFANIVVDGHFYAGRNGLGLIYSAKNLKYLTVKGSGTISVYDKELLKSAKEDILRLTSASPIIMGELGLTNYGTGALYDLMDSRRMMPTDNFKKTVFAPAKKMNSYSYKQKYKPEKSGCRGCHILCKKKTNDNISLPEFETMSHFSALINNDDIETVFKANLICNEYAVDTISCAATIACYLDIENKKLSSSEILQLIKDICLGNGVGKDLKQGSFRYAEQRNMPHTAMCVKKQELSAYDPRGAYGMALAYATSTRGGCHLRAYPISHEILRKPVVTDRFSFNGKARIIKIAEDMNAVIDSLTACKFVFFSASLEEYAKVYTAVTGIKSSAQDLLKIGERIYYNERIMNALNGFNYLDDDLPERFFNEPGTSGNNIIIKPIDRDDFVNTRSNYYKIRGLDQEGNPIPSKVKEHELD